MNKADVPKSKKFGAGGVENFLRICVKYRPKQTKFPKIDGGYPFPSPLGVPLEQGRTFRNRLEQFEPFFENCYPSQTLIRGNVRSGISDAF